MIVHLAHHDHAESEYCNAINSFYAGLGLALGKKVVFISPSQIVPIDYSDICIQYDDAGDCIAKLDVWVKKRNQNTLNIAVKKGAHDHEMNLLLLGIGYCVAEHEKENLIHYFVPTFAFNEAQKRKDMLIYGRKGAEKTALYYNLINKFSEKDTAVILQLKPEAMEVAENLRVSQLFDDTTTRSRAFHTIWKFLLSSQLLIEFRNIVVKKSRAVYLPEEEAIIDFYTQHERRLEQGFFKTITVIGELIVGSSITADKAIENLTKEYLTPIASLLQEYLRANKYAKIIIVADNLDKSWSAENDLTLQAEMILSLLQVTGEFQKSISEKQPERTDVSCLIFLREDIYKFVINKAREPDRLETMSYRIEWDTCRPLLKDIVEKRMKYVLKCNEDENMSSLWAKYFDQSEDIYPLVDNICIPRPRDIIGIFARMFESACNNNRLKVHYDDFLYAIDYYEKYLRCNLIAENAAEYPFIRELISTIDSNYYDAVGYNNFMEMLYSFTGNEDDSNRIVSALFENKIIIGSSKDQKDTYNTFDEFMTARANVNRKRWLLKKKFSISRCSLVSSVRLD